LHKPLPIFSFHFIAVAQSQWIAVFSAAIHCQL
jgi:hypothetical protein